MPKRVIKSLRKIQSVGRFVDWSTTADLPDWRRYNLFYGFNGSGKTTIARVLNDLSQPPADRSNIGSGQATIELDDGSTVNESSEAESLRGRVFVFSSDFVQDNFKWNESSANPVYYLGEEQAEQAEKLAALKNELVEKASQQVAATADFGEADRSLRSFKTEKARHVEQGLNAGRYNAASFAADMSQSVTVNDKISDPERAAYQKLIFSTETYSVIGLALPSSIAGEAELSECGEILSLAPESEALNTLHPHERMAGWVQTGAQYHLNNDLDRCLHCFEPLKDSSRARLEALVQDESQKLLARISANKTALSNARAMVAAVPDKVPNPSSIVPPQRESVETAADSIRNSVESLLARFDAAMASLNSKEERLGTALECPTALDAKLAAAEIASILSEFEALKTAVSSHNEAAAEIDTAKVDARRRLKRDMLFDALTQYKELSSRCYERQEIMAAANEAIANLNQQISEVEDMMKSHQAAAGHISNTVTRFLGHSELTVRPTNDGYSICRDGKPVSGPLSEGERTAIAFCYFLVMLTAEGRTLDDLIVIVDDPISSLDSGALNYTASLVTAHLQKCGQGVVLTHNINFFHEIKKWLKRMEAGKEADGTPKWKRAGLYYVSCKKDAGLGHRRSSIEKLSKLLREYESEYHYLFFLIGSAAKDKSVSDELSVLLPNAIRKGLDTFLAFRHPSSSPIEEKAADLVADIETFDKVRLSALLRLVQTESHADSIADSVSFCPMSTEEAYEACQNFMYYISVVDPDHFLRMKDICGLGDANALCGVAPAGQVQAPE